MVGGHATQSHLRPDTRRSLQVRSGRLPASFRAGGLFAPNPKRDQLVGHESPDRGRSDRFRLRLTIYPVINLFQQLCIEAKVYRQRTGRRPSAFPLRRRRRICHRYSTLFSHFGYHLAATKDHPTVARASAGAAGKWQSPISIWRRHPKQTLQMSPANLRVDRSDRSGCAAWALTQPRPRRPRT